MAKFNDSRCIHGCSTEPLLFTCELYEVWLLRVKYPTGKQDTLSIESKIENLDNLPDGFTVVAFNISEKKYLQQEIFL